MWNPKRVCGRAGAVADVRQATAGTRESTLRRRAAPDSNDFGETGLEGRCGATRGSGGRRHGGESRVRHGLGHEALLCWAGGRARRAALRVAAGGLAGAGPESAANEAAAST